MIWTFVHAAGCLEYIAPGERGYVLRHGKLPVGHWTPLVSSLIYVPLMLKQYDERFQCGQAARITALWERVWATIMGAESG